VTKAVSASTIRVDPELGRLAIGLSVANLFRLWCIVRDMTRQGDGSGKIRRSDFKDTLKKYGLIYSRQHLCKLIKDGQDLFWNTNHHFLFIRGYQGVAQSLTQKALENCPALVLDNRPGVRDVYLSPTGSHEQWEATLYAGWLTHREAPTISRERLSALFNRTPDTLRRWEEIRLSKQVVVRRNFAQLTDPTQYPYALPSHSHFYVAYDKDKKPQMRLRWQLPNTFIPKGIRQHPRKGQSRKVRRLVNDTVKHPAENRRGGMPSFRLYFDNRDHLKRYTQKRGGIGYLWLGENRHQHGIFEPTRDGYTETYANERLDFPLERSLIEDGAMPMQC
jgi:hypothetical protein